MTLCPSWSYRRRCPDHSRDGCTEALSHLQRSWRRQRAWGVNSQSFCVHSQGGAHSLSSLLILCPWITGLAGPMFHWEFSVSNDMQTRQHWVAGPADWTGLGCVGRIWWGSTSYRKSVPLYLLDLEKTLQTRKLVPGWERNRFPECSRANLRKNCWRIALRVAGKCVFDLLCLCETHTGNHVSATCYR